MGSGTSIMRFMIILFNSIFLLGGIAGLAGGIWMAVSPMELFEFIKYTFEGSEPFVRNSAYVLIGASVFIILVASLGCFGAWCRSRICLGVYAALLLIVIAMQIAAIVMIVIFDQKFQDKLKGKAANELRKWYNDTSKEEFTKAVDRLQKDFECCGVRNSKDFVRVPESCIGHEDKGCYESIKNWVKRNMAVVIGITVAVMVFQIALFVLAILLCKNREFSD